MTTHRPLSLPELAEQGFIAPDWAEALEPCAETLRTLGTFLRNERAQGRRSLPASDRILAAFQQPMSDIRVLVVGQDPYPTIGHSIGHAFAVERSVRPLPRSLQNIYRELADDLGYPPAEHGDLSSWTSEGVMLLNRVLTVEAGKSASHKGRGWEEVTAHAIRALVHRGGPLVAVLWGNQARALLPILEGTPTIQSAHPSPLSASRGFFGSRPFSRVNEYLVRAGAGPINWEVR